MTSLGELKKTNIIAISSESKTHHLLQMSGLVFVSNTVSVEELQDIIKKSKKPVALTEDFFFFFQKDNLTQILTNDPKSLCFIFNVANLLLQRALIENLLSQGFRLDLVCHTLVDKYEQDIIKELLLISKDIHLVLLENKMEPCQNFISNLDIALQPLARFCFLPKRSSFDALLSPEESLERIDLRSMELQQCGFSLSLKIYTSATENADTRHELSFYDKPSKEVYLHQIETQHKVSYLFLKIFALFKLSNFTAIFFWFVKTVLSPNSKQMREEAKGWACKIQGDVTGDLIRLRWSLVRLWRYPRKTITDLYWQLYKVKGLKGQFHAGLVKSYWFIRTTLTKSYWLIRTTLVRGYWLLRSIFIKAFWKTSIVVNRSSSQIYWKIYSLKRYAVVAYWLVRQTLGRLSYFLLLILYPVRKIYWFCEYQYKNRIKRIFAAKEME